MRSAQGIASAAFPQHLHWPPHTGLAATAPGLLDRALSFHKYGQDATSRDHQHHVSHSLWGNMLNHLLSTSLMFVGLLHCFWYPLYCQLDISVAASKEYGTWDTAETPRAAICLSLQTSQAVLRCICKAWSHRILPIVTTEAASFASKRWTHRSRNGVFH